MRDKINAQIKLRESFRPFAPAVLQEHTQAHFDLDHSLSVHAGDLPGRVLHASSRRHATWTGLPGSQTVSRDTNPAFAALIEKFHGMTGCPILLNTSFNLSGEPIVNTSLDAISCLRTQQHRRSSGGRTSVLDRRSVPTPAGADSPERCSPSFTPRTVDGMRDGMANRARGLLEPGRAVGSISILVGDYAQHFSLGIICQLIGVLAADEPMLLRWSEATVRMYEPAPSDHQQHASNEAAGAFRRYLLDVVADRRRSPKEDLLSALLDATVDRRAPYRRPDRLDGDGPPDGRARGRRQLDRQSSPRCSRLRPPPPIRSCAGRAAAPPPGASSGSQLLLQRFERWARRIRRPAEIEGCSIPARFPRDPPWRRSARRHPRSAILNRLPPESRGRATTISPLGGGIDFCIGAPLARLELETTITELSADGGRAHRRPAGGPPPDVPVPRLRASPVVALLSEEA